MGLAENKRIVFIVLALACLYVATILVIVGLCTNYWLEIRSRNIYTSDVEVHFGLHRVCWSKSDLCNNAGSTYDKTDSLPQIRGLVISGGILASIASLLAFLNFTFDRIGKLRRGICIAEAIVAFLAGILVMVGCILVSEKVEVKIEYLSIERTLYKGYSFGLSACAAGLMMIGSGFAALTTTSDASKKFVEVNY